MSDKVHAHQRAIVGLCPTCGLVLLVGNDHETWPLVRCDCGWAGGLGEMADERLIERRYGATPKGSR